MLPQNTDLIGLMAYPIRHSLSPEMQNKALRKADCHFTYGLWSG